MWVFDEISDHFSTGHTHCYMLYFHLSLPCMPTISKVLPICRKNVHVCTTPTNELQHLLLWTVGRRIGSAVIVRSKQIFSRRVSPFLENSQAIANPPTEKPVEGAGTYLNQRKLLMHSFPQNTPTELLIFRSNCFHKFVGVVLGGAMGMTMGMKMDIIRFRLREVVSCMQSV